MQSMQPTKERAAIVRLFCCLEKNAYLCTSRRDDGYISNFILTHAPVKIGAFLRTFGAVLLLTDKRKTANPLSVSGLDDSIMFNPKKPRIYNERVTNG